MEFRKISGKLDLVLARDGNARAIEVGQFAGRKGQWSDCGDGTGNPPQRLFFLGNFASGIGGSPMFFLRLRCPDIRPRALPRVVCEFHPAFSGPRFVRLPASWPPSPATLRRLAIIFPQSSPRRFPTVCGYRGRSRVGSRTADATPQRCDAAPCAMPLSCGW